MLTASMRLEPKLREWERAELITPEIAARILAHEQRRDRPLLLYAVGGIGALAIVIGLVSVIAANWDVLPPSSKLGGDMLMAVALAWGVVRAHKRGLRWLEDTLILVYHGLVLASIGLISQVYHLGGATHEALLIWSALTFLLVTRGHSGLLALVWILGLQATCVAWLVHLAESMDREKVALSLVYVAPLVCLAIGSSDKIRSWRPHFGRVFAAVGWTEVALCASFGPLAFYEDMTREYSHGLWVGFGLAAVLTGWLWTRISRLTAAEGARGVRILLVTAFLLSFVPMLVSTGDLDLLAALCFVGLWALIGWTAHELRLFWLLNLATALIAIRILIVYFEVFGSLLDTGLGLISGGLLTLLLAWLWVKKRKDFGADGAEAKEVS